MGFYPVVLQVDNFCDDEADTGQISKLVPKSPLSPYFVSKKALKSPYFFFSISDNALLDMITLHRFHSLGFAWVLRAEVLSGHSPFSPDLLIY